MYLEQVAGRVAVFRDGSGNRRDLLGDAEGFGAGATGPAANLPG